MASPESERSTTANRDTDQPPAAILQAVLGYASDRDYAGYDYSDGLSSPVCRALPGENRWTNLAFQEVAKRAPVNVRPLMLIPKRRSPKGVALFASAQWGTHQLTGHQPHRTEAIDLLEWLWTQRREQPFGWGHNHDIQQLDGLVPRNTPNIVSTTYATRSFQELATALDDETVSAVRRKTADFVCDSLVVTTEAGRRLRYHPGAKTDRFVINANALGAALLTELSKTVDDAGLRDLAEELFDYIVAQQQPSGGWYYMDPPESSHLSMDNHHNGFVIESLLRYRAITGDHRYDDSIDRAMQFYRQTLFEADGRPNWDESNAYPRDIHAAAQGIVTFVEAGELAFARQIIDWAVSTLYDGSGAFWYRQQRWYVKRFTLMRWCQAWMAYALARYAVAASQDSTEPLDPL